MMIPGIPNWFSILALVVAVICGWLIVDWAFTWWRPAREARPSTTVKSTTGGGKKLKTGERRRTLG